MSLVKQAPTRKKDIHSNPQTPLFLFMGTMFFAFGLIFFFAFAWPGIQELQRDHVRVQGTVLSSKVHTSRSSKGGTVYRPDISFTYSFNGQEYRNDRVGPLDFGSSGGRARRLVSQFPKGTTAGILVDPLLPDKGYLDTKENPIGVLALPTILPLLFSCVGLGFLIAGIRMACLARKRAKAPVGFAGLPMGAPKAFRRRDFKGLPAAVAGLGGAGFIGAVLAFILQDEIAHAAGKPFLSAAPLPLLIFSIIPILVFVFSVWAMVRSIVRELGSRHFTVMGRAAFSDKGGLAELTYSCDAVGTMASEVIVKLVARRSVNRKRATGKYVIDNETVVDKILETHSNTPVSAPRTLSIQAPDPDLDMMGIPLADDPNVRSLGSVRWYLEIEATFPDSRHKTEDEFVLG